MDIGIIILAFILFLMGIVAVFFPLTATPPYSAKKTSTVRVYFAEFANGGYEIYKNGKPTKVYVSQSQIQKMLTTSQYVEFLQGERIFHLNARAIQNKKQKTTVNDKAFTLNNFKSDSNKPS